MFTRFSFLGITLVALLAVPVTSRGGTNGPLIQRKYLVADLVIPVVDQSTADFFLMPEVAERPCPGKPQPAPQRNKETRARQPVVRNQPTLENRLIQRILHEIEPSSWSENGGAATIEYDPLGYALVVKQTAENHERLNEVLAALHKLQGVEVSAEIRLVSVPEDLFPRLMEMVNLEAREAHPCSISGCKSAGRIRSSPGRKLGYLNDRQILQLIEAAQRDRRTSVVQTPKLTLFDGQSGVISVTDQQCFVTGVKPVQANAANEQTLVPVNQPFELGVKFALKPTVSADRRSVRLDLKANLANLASENVPSFPVTIFLTPVLEGRAQGQPIPFTQSIQMPQFERQTLDTKVVIPDGGTVVFGAWRTTRELREVLPGFLEGLPILDQIVGVLAELPGGENLRGSVTYHRESVYLVMLVTPKIIVSDEAEKAKKTAAVRPTSEAGSAEEPEPKEPPLAAAAQPQKISLVGMPYCVGPADHVVTAGQLQRRMVAELLAAYREACTAGNHAEAQKLAHMALALDPMCFHGSR